MHLEVEFLESVLSSLAVISYAAYSEDIKECWQNKKTYWYPNEQIFESNISTSSFLIDIVGQLVPAMHSLNGVLWITQI